MAIKINEKTTLPLIFKIISIVLFVCGFIFIYNFAEPAQSTAGPLTVKIFYILFALGAASCVGLLFNVNPLMRMLTPFLFIAALCAVFCYQTSGNYYYLKENLKTQSLVAQPAELSGEMQELMALLGNDSAPSNQEETDGEKTDKEKALVITFNEEPQLLFAKIFFQADSTF